MSQTSDRNRGTATQGGLTPKVGEKPPGSASQQGGSLASFVLGNGSRPTVGTKGPSGSNSPAAVSSPGGTPRATPKKAALSLVSPAGSPRMAGTGRVSSFSNNSSGVAGALGKTIPTVSSLGSTQSRSKAATATEQEHVLGDVVVTYGHSSFQGMRDYQEDAVATHKTGISFAAGVFDGHGGDQVSKELERVLLQNIQQQLAQFSSTDLTAHGPPVNDIHNAISTAYTSTNSDIGTRMESAMEAGSCAVTCLIYKADGELHLFCANAGDCRAVLYSGPPGAKRAIRLSQDHKPQAHVSPSEVARVCNAGGCVLWGRVQGCLAVSRAFGDKTLAPYVIADPHTISRPLNPVVDDFIYLVSDGVTDLIEDGAGCAIVNEQLSRGNSTAQAAAALTQAAYQQGSSDNISAIVIRISHRCGGGLIKTLSSGSDKK